MVTLFNINKVYGPLMASIYESIIQPSSLEEKLNLIGQKIRHYDPQNLLDIGCGNGLILKELANKFQTTNFNGIDNSSEQIKKCRQFSKIKNLTFSKESIESTHFKNNQFDFIMAMGSIKHWENQNQCLGECHRILNSDGVFFISELNPQASLKQIEYFISKWKFIPFKINKVVEVYKKLIIDKSPPVQELRVLLEKNNFRVITSGESKDFPFYYIICSKI